MDDSIANIFIGQSGPDVQQLDGLGMALRRAAMGGASAGGLAPHGMRHDGMGAKGNGYFGPLAMQDGSFATEISTGDDIGEFPMIVPTLDRAQLAALLAGQPASDSIYEAARAFAEQRRAAGKNPFMEPGELRYPLPAK